MEQIRRILFVLLIGLFCSISALGSETVWASEQEYSSSYGYQTLTEGQKKAYRAILIIAEEFHNGSKNAQKYSASEGTEYITSLIDLTSFNVYVEDIEKIMFAIDADHPMFFWYKGTVYSVSAKKYSISKENRQVLKLALTVYPEYKNGTQRRSIWSQIETAIAGYTEKIVSLKKNNASVLEIERYIHDTIILNTEYSKAYGNMVHNVQGVFVTGSAVCEGYAKAFQLLCNYAGIESIYAIGYSEGKSHAWNLVKIDGKWHNIDVTWDDLGDETLDGSLGISYQYFNCPDSRFMVSHEYSSDFPEMYQLPSVSSTLKATYYKYYDLTVTSDDLASDKGFCEFMKKAMAQSEESGEYVARILVNENLSVKFESRYKRNKEKVEEMMSGTACAYRIEDVYHAEEIVNLDEKFSYVYNVVFEKLQTQLIDEAIPLGMPEYQVKRSYGRCKKKITSKTTAKFEKGILYVYRNTDQIASIKMQTSTMTVSSISDKVYRNKMYTPKPEVRLNGKQLILNKDYTLSYKNNKEAGTASVIINGIGQYSGTKTVYFQIKQRTIRSVSYNTLANVTYTGKTVKPKLVLTLNGNKLVSGKDYTVTYSNNKEIGTAKVTIKAKGNNYTGSKCLTFSIVPKKVTGVKVEKSGDTVKISWEKISGVTGYEIIFYDTNSGKSKKKVKTSNNFIKLSETSEIDERFIIRAYKTVKKYKYYGQKSKIVRIN